MDVLFSGLCFYAGTKSVDKTMELEPKWRKTIDNSTARFLYVEPTYCIDIACSRMEVDNMDNFHPLPNRLSHTWDSARERGKDYDETVTTQRMSRVLNIGLFSHPQSTIAINS